MTPPPSEPERRRTDAGQASDDPEPVAPRVASAEHRSARPSLWKQLRSNRSGQIGLLILAVTTIMVVAGPWLAPYDYAEQDVLSRRAPPSVEHPLGLDELGRDELSRLLVGARFTVAAGLLAVLVGAAIGIPAGLLAGYLAGLVETIVMRTTDVLLAFPSFLVAVLVVAILGPNLVNATVAVGFATVPAYIRLVRGNVLSVKQNAYVPGAIVVGCSPARIMFRHVLPNVLAPTIVLASLSLATAILSIAGLSFLGLGAQPPTPEWGLMLGQGRGFIREAPHITLAPGLAITLVVLAANLLGDALRDALDIRLRAL